MLDDNLPPGQDGELSWSDVIDGYWRHYAALGDIVEGGRTNALGSRTAESDHTWAWEEVEYATRRAGLDIVDRLVELADAAPGEAALSYLGAGPIEDLVTRDADRFLKAITAAAQRSPAFRCALGGVNCDGRMSFAMRECLQRYGASAPPDVP